MRNIIDLKKSLVVAASFAALIVGGISVAQAGPAVVSRAEGCGLLDGNGVGQLGTNSKITFTQNPNGNATFQCRADVTPATSGGAAHFDLDSTGYECAVPDPLDAAKEDQMTKHWEETVSASGEATLTCHLP